MRVLLKMAGWQRNCEYLEMGIGGSDEIGDWKLEIGDAS